MVASTAVLLIGLMVSLPQLLLFFELPRITRACMGLVFSLMLLIDFAGSNHTGAWSI
jgi:hypothetical protein